MGKHAAVLSHRMVQDPYITDAEYLHQRQTHPHKPNVGKVLVQENLSTRIGGLANIPSRLLHHEQAAQRFKAMYEGRYGAAPSIDMAKQRVDVTIMAHDSGMAQRVDNGREVMDILAAMGKEDGDLLVGVIVLGIPLKDYTEKGNWREVGKLKDRLFGCLDNMALRWGLLSRRAIDGRA